MVFCIKAPLNLWILALYIKSFDIDIIVIIPSHFNFLNHSRKKKDGSLCLFLNQSNTGSRKNQEQKYTCIFNIKLE